MDHSNVTVLLGAGSTAELEALEFALEQRPGITVIGCDSSVGGAVRKVATGGPDVAVVSADKPDWGGIRACEEIKRLPAPARVIVIGPAGHDEMLLSAVKAGADGFVTDEDSLEDLVAALHKVCNGESHIPPMMLGSLLRGLIEFRREDDAAFERFASLGNRQREVLVEICSGLADQAIAAKLHLSPHTARTRAQTILTKLGVHSRLEATRLVFEHDLFGRFGIDTEAMGDGRGGGK